MNRANQTPSQPSRPASPPESVELPPRAVKNAKNHRSRSDLFVLCTKIGTGVLLFIVALLVAAVFWLIYTTTPSSEKKYVDSTKLQAIFLNSGQVYFGNVQDLNSTYFVLTNIFYLQTPSSSSGSAANQPSSQSQNVSLVKLGCELHMPYDRMVINSDQVTFWENLQSDGQVAKAVATYEKDNPSGQKCSDQSAAPNSGTNLQNQTNTGTGSTNTNSPSTTPKQ